MGSTFGDWLHDERRRRGLSQTELASKSNITPAAISNLELGKRKPGIKSCKAIAVGLGISPQEVLKKAYLFPETQSGSKKQEKINLLYDQLNYKNQEEAVQFLTFLKEQQDERDKYSTGQTKA